MSEKALADNKTSNNKFNLNNHLCYNLLKIKVFLKLGNYFVEVKVRKGLLKVIYCEVSVLGQRESILQGLITEVSDQVISCQEALGLKCRCYQTVNYSAKNCLINISI